MRQARRPLLSVMAVLLLMQWAAALQPCLRTLTGLASAMAVELCTPAGHGRTILVDENGREIPKAQAHAGCPLCQHAEPAMLPGPPVVPAPAALPLAVVQDAPRPGLPPLPPRGPPQQPRAPPSA